jgi:hypothetical protein
MSNGKNGNNKREVLKKWLGFDKIELHIKDGFKVFTSFHYIVVTFFVIPVYA